MCVCVCACACVRARARVCVCVVFGYKIIKNGKFLILPGVGSFAEGINKLRNRDLFEILIEKVKKGKPMILETRTIGCGEQEPHI